MIEIRLNFGRSYELVKYNAIINKLVDQNPVAHNILDYTSEVVICTLRYTKQTAPVVTFEVIPSTVNPILTLI